VSSGTEAAMSAIRVARAIGRRGASTGGTTAPAAEGSDDRGRLRSVMTIDTGEDDWRDDWRDDWDDT